MFITATCKDMKIDELTRVRSFYGGKKKNPALHPYFFENFPIIQAFTPTIFPPLTFCWFPPSYPAGYDILVLGSVLGICPFFIAPTTFYLKL